MSVAHPGAARGSHITCRSAIGWPMPGYRPPSVCERDRVCTASGGHILLEGNSRPLCVSLIYVVSKLDWLCTMSGSHWYTRSQGRRKNGTTWRNTKCERVGKRFAGGREVALGSARHGFNIFETTRQTVIYSRISIQFLAVIIFANHIKKEIFLVQRSSSLLSFEKEIEIHLSESRFAKTSPLH